MRYKFIDKIENIELGEIRGIKCLSLNEDIFEDHFPSRPMLPAAMMVESFVELSRYYFWHISQYELTCHLEKIDNIKFYQTAQPGSRMTIVNSINVVNSHLKCDEKIEISTAGFIDDKKLFDGKFRIYTLNFSSFHDKSLAIKNMNIIYQI